MSNIIHILVITRFSLHIILVVIKYDVLVESKNIILYIFIKSFLWGNHILIEVIHIPWKTAIFPI